jgi:hypothetical protein
MSSDRGIRRALWASAVFNMGGALGFAFPDTIGRLAGFPPGPVPVLYSATLAMLVALLGGTYAWLASQPIIDRPLVGFAAIGKAAFFVVVLGCWLAGEVSALGVFSAGGDLVFAAIFARWLMADVPVGSVASRATS